MASDYGLRGQAAMRLLKGGKKGPPPGEEELGLPPEDELAPPEGAPDLAALLGGGAPGELPPDEGAPPDPALEGEEPMPEELPGPPDLDTALAGVEGALEGMSPEAAEEIRTHLNAIREIAARGGTQPGPALPTEPPAPELGGTAQEGAMEKPEGA